MSDVQDVSLLLRIASDFLTIGAREPLELGPEGARAIAIGVQLSDRFGGLEAGLEELLLFTHHLATRAESPTAARSIRQAIATPKAIAALGVEGGHDIDEQLSQRAKRLTRERHRLRAEKGGRIADYLGAASQHTPSARRRMS